MIRMFFLVLWIIFLQSSQVQAIDIYANGHKYDSFQDYLASKKLPNLASLSPVTLNSQQVDYIREEAQQLGIGVDFNKIKTIQVGRETLSNVELHKFYILSVENGVVDALYDFYHTWGQTDFQEIHKITSLQVQKAIQDAVVSSQSPKLLISTQGKVRIMALKTGT